MRQRPQTIWGKIKEALPIQEHYEAKSILGPGIIEQVDEIMTEMESFSTLALFSSILLSSRTQ
uniref:Sperm flagellar protein 2 n=1 Tax=Mesocestoides corti TaxID=53468 RepID=A0A5K3F6R6_MESCO